MAAAAEDINRQNTAAKSEVLATRAKSSVRRTQCSVLALCIKTAVDPLQPLDHAERSRCVPEKRPFERLSHRALSAAEVRHGQQDTAQTTGCKKKKRTTHVEPPTVTFGLISW